MIYYFPIETISRELDSRILLAAFLSKHADAIFIIPYRIFIPLSPFITPGVVIMTNPDPLQIETLIIPLKRVGHEVVIIEEELLFPTTDAAYFQYRYSSDGILKHIGKIVMSPSMKKEVSGLKNKIDPVVIFEENPRLFLTGAFAKRYFGDEIALIKRAFGKFVIFNSHLSIDLLNNATLRNYYRNSLDAGQITHRQRRDLCELRLFSEIKDLVKKMSSELPGIQIVVRPHPVDSMAAWREQFFELSNVIVSKDFPSIVWSLCADTVIHSGCTTGFEAARSGVKCVAYIPSHYEEFAEKESLTGSVICKTGDDVVAEIKKTLRENISKFKAIKIEEIESNVDLVNFKESKLISYLKSVKPNPSGIKKFRLIVRIFSILLKSILVRTVPKINGQYTVLNLSLLQYEEELRKSKKVDVSYVRKKLMTLGDFASGAVVNGVGPGVMITRGGRREAV